MRFSAGAGLKNGRGFQELRFRPVYHELLDNPKGYIEGAQISFLNTALRYYPYRNSARIEQLDVIDIVSIAPRDELFSPVSWKITTGLFRRDISNEDDAPVIRLNPGAGVAFSHPLLGLWYIMAGSRSQHRAPARRELVRRDRRVGRRHPEPDRPVETPPLCERYLLWSGISAEYL